MMKKSKDLRAQQFIDSIPVLDSTKYEILNTLRKIVFNNFPDVKERMMYGGILFSDTHDFGGVFVYAKHISFEFSNGYLFDDPEKILEGKGKYRRHLKFRSLDDIETKKATYFIKQSKRIEK